MAHLNVEIEAIDLDGSLGAARLREQCRSHMDRLEIGDADLLSESYADMLSGADR